jgi:uridine kinase
MEYEIPVLKVFTEPLLNAVPSSSPHFARACELLHLLSFFNPMSPAKVPQTRCVHRTRGGVLCHCT